MAFNGNGVFVRLYNWANDAAANIKIRADRMDNEMNGFATGLSTCVTKDGQTTITANLPMAGFRHTGVGNAASRTDYSSFGQVQDGKSAWAAAGGTSDAITASYSIPITALVDGQLCYVRAGGANATTTPTFSPNSLTARTIVKNGGNALAVGDIAGSGHELELRYDLSNTRWELMNPKSAVVPFTPASASGAAALEFAEDTDNGSNKITLKGPASVASNADVTLPDTAGTLALTASIARINDFRLTLTTGVPVTITDVTGAGTLYFTPYKGNLISLYTSSAWKVFSTSEISISLSGYTSGKPYDVFVYDNGGTPTLLTTVWTDDTTRATSLAYQDGVLVQSGTPAYRYVGTIYTSGTGTTEDSVTKRYVWNYYNRVIRNVAVQETGSASHDYTTATWRNMNNSASNAVKILRGVAEDAVRLTAQAFVQNTSAAVIFATGIGIDSSTVNSAQIAASVTPAANVGTIAMAEYVGCPSTGLHTYNWLQYSAATGTATWFTFNGVFVSGLVGTTLA